MKKFLFTFLIITCCIGKSYCQNIKINPFLIPQGIFNMAFEYSFTDHSSVFIPFTLFNSMGDGDDGFNGNSYGASIRLYLSGNAPDGWFFSPGFRIMNIDDDFLLAASSQIDIYMYGLDWGCQWLIGDHFLINGFIGGYAATFEIEKTRTNYSTGAYYKETSSEIEFMPNIGFGIGVKF